MFIKSNSAFNKVILYLRILFNLIDIYIYNTIFFMFTIFVKTVESKLVN